MADLKISQFADGGAVQPTDEIATNRAGVNTKVFVGGAAALDAGTGSGDLLRQDGGGETLTGILTNAQSWQDVIGSRAHSTSYQNTTLRPIMVNISAVSTADARDVEVSDDNSTWITLAITSSSAQAVPLNCSFIVPSGYYYRVNGDATIGLWAEFR